MRGGQVVPLEDDRRLPCLDGGGSGDDLHVVAGLAELVEEVHALADVIQRPALGDRGHDHAVETLAGDRRIAGKGDGALESGTQQVVNRVDVRHLRRVVTDAHVAAVVVEPEAAGLLAASRDVSPCRHLVGREEAGVLHSDRLSHINHVRSATGAVEGVDLRLAAATGVERGDLDVVLSLEAADGRAVVRPVGRQRADGELAFGLGGRNQGVHSATTGGRCLLRPVGRSRSARGATRGDDEHRRHGNTQTMEPMPVHKLQLSPGDGWLQEGRPGAGAALYCASTDFGARNHAGAGRKDQLSLVDVLRAGLRPVTEPARQVVCRLARARDHLP